MTGGDAEALAKEKATSLSALKWLAHNSAFCNSTSIWLHSATLSGADLPAAHLDWPNLLAAGIVLDFHYETQKGLAREWLQYLIGCAPKLQALCLERCFYAVLPFAGLKHLCVTMPDMPLGWDVVTFEAGLTALPHLETLELGSLYDDYQFLSEDLDLSACPTLCQARFEHVGPAGLELSSGCSLQLAMPATYLFWTDYEMPVAQIWEAWAAAARVVRMHFTDVYRDGHDEFMSALAKFTCLEHLEVEHAGAYQPVSLLDFGVCSSLARVTVLKVTFVTSERQDGGESRGARIVIPAAWRLKTLVVTDVDQQDVKVELRFQDPGRAAQSLEDLFVPGLGLNSAHFLLMADAFQARGLMLSAARCPEGWCYVYLKELAAAASSFAALYDRYAKSAGCDCGVCWSCCLRSMGLDPAGYY